MKRRIREIDPGTPAGIKKWAELQYEIQRTLRENLGLPIISKSWREVAGHSIDIYDSDFSSMIRIKGGCKDRRGFLLVKSGPALNPDYDAYYNDGEVERVGGAVQKRLKKWTPPTDLSTGTVITRNQASKYTGIMRRVVGCYHVAGPPSTEANAPFDHSFGRTHGIVKFTLSDGKTKHFLIEISSLGLYAAPIVVKKNCCDSYQITTYQPTDAELAENPGWQQYRTTTSLWWAKVYGMRENVIEVLDATAMAPPYTGANAGTPWYTDHGWAFSASGQKVRIVLGRAENLPESHYEMNQWEISLTYNEAIPTVQAVLVNLDSNKVFTPLITGQTWIPSDSAEWAGLDAFAPSGPEVLQYPTQDAPIYVYFDGEDPVETRWTLSYGTVAAFTTPPVTVVGGTVTWDGLRVANIPPVVPGFSCYASSGIWTMNYPNRLYGGTGENSPSYTNIEFGYSNGRGSSVGNNHGSRSRSLAVTEGPSNSEFFTITFPNPYGLHPDCYYIDPTTMLLVTVCSSTFGNDYQWDRFRQRFQGFTETRVHRAAFVMFAEDREASLIVNDDSLVQSGSENITKWKVFRPYIREYKVDLGLCPLDDVTINFIQGNIAPDEGTAENGVTIDVDTISGAAHLDIGSNEQDYTATFNISKAWNNYNIGTFLDYNPTTKPTATSNVLAMHGNLNAPDSKLSPPDQTDNRVTLLDNDLKAQVGFADIVGSPIAFVGKV